MLPHGVIVP